MDNQQELFGFSKPSLVSLEPSAKTVLVQHAKANSDEKLLLCLFYFHREMRGTEEALQLYSREGHQIGFFEKSKVPEQATMVVDGYQMAFRLMQSTSKVIVSFSGDSAVFCVREAV